MRPKLINKRKGSVLTYVLIILIILSIITTSIAFLFSSNFMMAKRQEENMRAYYLALSGIDITISTLLSTVEIDSNGEEKSMVSIIEEDNVDREFNDEIEIEGDKVKINLKYDSNKKEFIIKSSVELDYLKKDLTASISFYGNSYRVKWN